MVVAPSADFEFEARAQAGAARALDVASLQTVLTLTIGAIMDQNDPETNTPAKGILKE